MGVERKGLGSEGERQGVEIAEKCLVVFVKYTQVSHNNDD